MLVAITGGTGFIGRRLAVSHLERGDQVRLLSRRRVTGFEGSADVYRADLTDTNADLRSFVEGADIVYHCAGQLADESSMSAVHVDGTARLVRAAAGHIGRWVQLSSVGVYGFRCSGVVNEGALEAPQGIYEATKAQGDALVADAAANGAFDHVLLRPSIVYGPEMTNQSLFQLINMIARGLFFFIGPPGAIVNYVHVQGVVAALIACGTHVGACGHTYILSDDSPLESVVRTIATALRKPEPRLRVPLAPVMLIAQMIGRTSWFPLNESRVRVLTKRVTYDGSRIEKDLGYRQPVNLEQGLCEMVRHWQKRH